MAVSGAAAASVVRQSASASPEGAPPPKQPVVKLKQSSWGSRDQVWGKNTLAEGCSIEQVFILDLIKVFVLDLLPLLGLKPVVSFNVLV